MSGPTSNGGAEPSSSAHWRITRPLRNSFATMHRTQSRPAGSEPNSKSQSQTFLKLSKTLIRNRPVGVHLPALGFRLRQTPQLLNDKMLRRLNHSILECDFQ